jgi:hypothetical protein
LAIIYEQEFFFIFWGIKQNKIMHMHYTQNVFIFLLYLFILWMSGYTSNPFCHSHITLLFLKFNFLFYNWKLMERCCCTSTTHILYKYFVPIPTCCLILPIHLKINSMAISQNQNSPIYHIIYLLFIILHHILYHHHHILFSFDNNHHILFHLILAFFDLKQW